MEDRLSCRNQRHIQILGHIQVDQLESVESARVRHKVSYVHVVECLSVVRTYLLPYHHPQLQGCHLHPH